MARLKTTALESRLVAADYQQSDEGKDPDPH
jgi:hypothetical protein